LVLIDRYDHKDCGRDADKGVSAEARWAAMEGALKPDQRADNKRTHHSADDDQVLVSQLISLVRISGLQFDIGGIKRKESGLAIPARSRIISSRKPRVTASRGRPNSHSSVERRSRPYMLT